MSKPNTIQEVNSHNPMKRARYSSVWEDDNDEVETELAGDNRKNEHVTDAIVKFLVSINASIDSYKNSHFRTLLRRVAQHGVPSCLFREDSLPIQRSVWNLEHEVNEYIMEVKDSWKTTGCTMMLYKLNEGEGNLSSLHKDNLVFGFYSTKGFFFVDGRTLPHSDSLRNAFKKHFLNLSTDNVTQAIYHSQADQPCELSSLTPYYEWFYDLKAQSSVPYMPCAQQVINQSFKNFSQTSYCWIQNLIKNSEILHKYIVDNCLYLDWEKESARMIVDGALECWFKRFLSIMRFEDELKTWLLCLPKGKKSSLEGESGIAAIINSYEFWRNGRKLEEALWPLSRVSDILDNLVPTSGYLQMALDAAIDKDQFAQFDIDSQHFNDLLNGCHLSNIKDAATYLSPGFYLYHQEEGKNVGLIDRVKNGLESIVVEEEKEAMYVELETYITKSSNPFANLADDEHLEYHPVTLWHKYGNEFPILKKCAMKVLSQTATCMCKQVKRHLSQIEGKENLVLRLNYRMMEEYKQLGDGIYNHVDY